MMIDKNGKRPKEILNDEVKPKEILEYFESKYNTVNIVSQRTIKNWLNELGIECIQPRPKRNADIRYNKSDVLKLEEAKKENLLQKQHQDLWESKKMKIAEGEREKEQDYYDYLSSMTEEERTLEDNSLSYYVQADEIIKNDMLEMCFKQLFPNATFNREELARNLYNSQIINNDAIKGEAINYLKNKLYIRKEKA
ncbi:hypothetical protein [Paraliobacillus ryukyuensis]|uniref:hypothetical protein n=1 Tax=Paraliobacillus ryukyuensis TaxID=200904 RepID=UPI0009A7000D|nr:hypothetical protein [Paraliobacillus ryukyuensis]